MSKAQILMQINSLKMKKNELEDFVWKNIDQQNSQKPPDRKSEELKMELLSLKEEVGIVEEQKLDLEEKVKKVDELERRVEGGVDNSMHP